MGCDIHLAAEVRRRFYYDSRPTSYWARVVPPRAFRNPWPGENDKGKGDPFWAVRSVVEWYSGRNYELFGILAGVRGDATPIAEPRGLPKDLGDECKALRKNWNGPDIHLGEHSQSWLTLAELQKHSKRLHMADSDFVDRVMAGLATLGNPEDVRIVFGFDS